MMPTSCFEFLAYTEVVVEKHEFQIGATQIGERPIVYILGNQETSTKLWPLIRNPPV